MASGAAATEPSTVATSASGTDFGIRTVEGGRLSDTNLKIITPTFNAPFEMNRAVEIARGYGRVTSTYRSAAHNRRVGGARNSWHMQNRAIDIVPRHGVSHRQIDAAFRSAGYRLIESLDEGDHSHFAFANGLAMPASDLTPRPAVQMVTTGPRPTDFRIVTVPPSR